jgi:putative flippase GtrA
LSILGKVIVLAVAVLASIIVILWILMEISEWAAAHQYETSAIVTVIILSIVAFVWRVFLWKKEE